MNVCDRDLLVESQILIATQNTVRGKLCRYDFVTSIRRATYEYVYFIWGVTHAHTSYTDLPNHVFAVK